MPEIRKDQTASRTKLTQELDMPEYRYQRAEVGSFTLKYEDAKDKRPEERRPILASLSFAHC